jgi:hypothetical protein
MVPKYVKKILEFFTERKIRGKVFHSSTVVGSRLAGVHGNDIAEWHLPATIMLVLTFCLQLQVFNYINCLRNVFVNNIIARDFFIYLHS